MSTTAPPDVRTKLKKHTKKNALALLYGQATQDAILKKIDPSLETLFYDMLGGWADETLTKLDKWATMSAKELWNKTSVFTGNTRGSLVVEGEYPFIEIHFDEDLFLRPKTLTNLREFTLQGRKKQYTYAAGSRTFYKNGDDYSAYVPSPSHSGFLPAITEAYEEMLKINMKKVGL